MDPDKQLLEVLFEKATLWESTVDSVPWIMVLMTEQGLVLRTNRQIEEWGLCKVASAPGKHWHQMLHPSCVGRECYLINVVNRAICNESFGSIQVFDPDLGRWVLVEISRVDLKRPLQSGTANVALLSMRDVTKIREHHAFEIRATRVEATRFLLRGMAHELGNPLAGMRTTLEVMMENIQAFNTEKIQEYLGRLYSCTMRLSEMIRKTLHDGGKQTFEPSTLPTLQLINDAVEVLMEFARAAGVEVISQCDASSLHADRIAAHEVLLNVLKNAIEACVSGGIVRICGIGQWDCTQITIVDSGIGMDNETIRKLFIPYSSSKPTGSGIGLAYSNALMTRMNGNIAVHSSKGEGTCVTLSFNPGSRNAHKQ